MTHCLRVGDSFSCHVNSLSPHSDESDWGDGLRGLRLQNALDSLTNIPERLHTKNWRPQILCLVKLDEEGAPTHPEILSFVEQLKKGRGLTIVAAIKEVTSRRT